MPQFDRHYSLAEARARIPGIRRIFATLHPILNALRRDAGNAAETPANVLVELPKSPCNGHPHGPPGGWSVARPGMPADQVAARMTPSERKAAAEALVRRLVEDGIVIQDLDRGLIDFPAWLDGREVLLCYELDDGDRLAYWHEIHAGYAGRQPVLGKTFWGDGEAGGDE